MPRLVCPRKSNLKQLQLGFMAILPRIEAHGQVYFRHERCASTKEDYLAEMTALSWSWFVRLVQKGKDPTRFVSVIASFAARAVKSGRRLCGQEKAKDVMSPRAQQTKGFCVGTLPSCSTLSSNPLADALIDNTHTPPDEQACFRLDFPVWLTALGDYKRRIAEALMMGERALDVAERHGMSASRVSQMRREFMGDWRLFCGDVTQA